ncbi:cilia- and flagella-associated protein 52-like [Columba livia]|uniref:cilia- and flagella-associated protein 52-like n=2 Tax=Columba livia TaxID=8932 RepID=UPI0031BA71CF
MAAAKGDGAVGELELQAAIGFNGHVPCGLICHPDREHILYPLGCTVVIQHLDTKKQSFLHGHTDNVSCVAVSRDGMYVASGQVTCIGFKADVILWDFPKQELLARLSLHEGKVEGLSFSPRGIYLVSLGGQDDGRVMVWDVSKRGAVCGSPASPRSAGNANVVMCSSCRDEMFVTAGNFTIRVWELDTATKKIHPSECYAGQLRRITMCVQMTDDDGDFYLGTTSGDVLKVNTSSKVLTACGPQKKKLSMHVHLAQSPWLKPPEGLNSRVLRAEGKVPNALETKLHQKYTSESTAKEAVRQSHEQDAVPFGGPKEKAEAQSQSTVQSVL